MTTPRKVWCEVDGTMEWMLIYSSSVLPGKCVKALPYTRPLATLYKPAKEKDAAWYKVSTREESEAETITVLTKKTPE